MSHVPPPITPVKPRFRRYTPGSFFALGAAGIAVPLLGFCLLGGVASAFRQPGEDLRTEDIPLWANLLMLAVLLSPLVINGVLLYRMWAQIQNGSPRTSAGLAVGLMFVPVLNLYWMFHAFYGLAKDLNEYCDQRQIATARTPAWAALVACILMLVPCLPLVLGLVIMIVAPITGLIVLGLAYLLSFVLSPLAGIFGQIAWWFMIAQSAGIARVGSAA